MKLTEEQLIEILLESGWYYQSMLGELQSSYVTDIDMNQYLQHLLDAVNTKIEQLEQDTFQKHFWTWENNNDLV